MPLFLSIVKAVGKQDEERLSLQARLMGIITKTSAAFREKSGKKGKEKVKKRLFALMLSAFIVWGSVAASGESRAMENFLVISDTHLTEKEEDHSAVLEAVIRAARNRDAVVLLGDNTNNTHPAEHDLVLRWAEEIRR